MTKIRTLGDVLMEKAMANAEEIAREAKARKRSDEIAACLKANPQIGTLMRDGRPVYYTYPAPGTYREARNPETLI